MKSILSKDAFTDSICFSGYGTTQEDILEYYHSFGTECLHHISGSFAFVLYDKEKDLYFGARDRFGVIPFYYAKAKGKFYCSTELEWLVDNSDINISPDNQMIFDYLVFNRTDHSDHTFFSGIKKLPHGHFFIIKNGEMRISKWYDLKTNVKKAIPYSSPNEFLQELTDTIDRQANGNHNIAVSLSGGLDSSAIASILIKALKIKNLNTYSAIYQKGQRADESAFINEFIPLLKNMHFVFPTKESLFSDLSNFLNTHVEPMPTLGPYAQYKVMEAAQGNSIVMFDGQGADEEMAGYSYAYGFYFKDLLMNYKFMKLLREMKSYYEVQNSTYCFKTFAYFLLPNFFKTRIKADITKDLSKGFIRRYSRTSTLASELYGSTSLQESLINHFEYKLEHLLKWSYNNAKTRGIICKEPFLHPPIVERLLATENSMKINNGYTKSILREAMKGIMPEKIRLRTDKVGFATPQDDWFKSNFFIPFIQEIIMSKSFADRGYFNIKEVQQLYKKHCNGEINISKTIWKWINIELWFRKYDNRFIYGK